MHLDEMRSADEPVARNNGACLPASTLGDGCKHGDDFTELLQANRCVKRNHERNNQGSFMVAAQNLEGYEGPEDV